MNHLPRRPDMGEHDEMIVPPEHPEFSEIGRSPRFVSCIPIVLIFAGIVGLIALVSPFVVTWQ
jgi:hypothetical protein